MSATKAVERATSRRGPTVRVDNDGNVIRSASRVWTVYTDSYRDDGYVAISHQDIPSLRSSYRTDTSADGNLFVQEITPRQLEQKLWEITVRYATDQPGSLTQANSGGKAPDNPMDVPVKRSWSSAPFDEFPSVDLNNAVVANSAGQPFDPGIAVPSHRAIWTWVRNEPFFRHDVATRFQNKVNSRPFLGQPSNSVIMLPWEANENWQNGIYYVQVTYRMEAGHFEHGKPGRTYAQGRAAGQSPLAAKNAITPATPPIGTAHLTSKIDQGSYEIFGNPVGSNAESLGGTEPDFLRRLPTDDEDTKFVGPQELLDGSGAFISREKILKGEHTTIDFITRHSIDFNLLGLF